MTATGEVHAKTNVLANAKTDIVMKKVLHADAVRTIKVRHVTSVQMDGLDRPVNMNVLGIVKTDIVIRKVLYADAVRTIKVKPVTSVQMGGLERPVNICVLELVKTDIVMRKVVFADAVRTLKVKPVTSVRMDDLVRNVSTIAHLAVNLVIARGTQALVLVSLNGAVKVAKQVCMTTLVTIVNIETETNVEQHTQSIAALLGGVCGGVVILVGIVVIGHFLLRRRRDNFYENKSKLTEREPENFFALYATVIEDEGPMAEQLGDFGQFWRMVWQQKVEKIVMMTNLVEGEKTNCEQYWPDSGEKKVYGDIEVVCRVEKVYADFIWRQFTFSQDEQNSEERNLHHFQFTAWSNKDTPDDVTSIIEFRQKVNALSTTFDEPVIVHCSAGVGRTGTYIALDILTNEGEAEGAIDIPGCVLNMRQNRPSMIQTLSQYKYLHQALVHSLTVDCSLIKKEHFHAYMTMMSSKRAIQRQFEKMQLNQKQKTDGEVTEKNWLLTNNNRNHAAIPGDSNRPRLYLFLKPGESDYINAIYIDSFKTKNRFLVAQTPLPDTVSDFIALAVQENCSCIVSMEAQGIGLYVPGDNLSMKKSVISIFSTREQSTQHFVKRKLHFKHDGKNKSELRIPHYQYLDWDRNHTCPKSAENFVAFIKEVEDASKSSHMHGPILVHCMNGAGKSGLLCVVSTLLEALSEDDEVSVVNAVRKVRARRPLSIPSVEQFYFCHECVLYSVNR
ncbi:receptor-type tyrosine-protein phosphatase kappa-like [Mya arenaria]|uniref:receptor-type tyrosine-protein phosphatase kappa-like n=1 Tax=Mya arenaria TaxID=6604 RepID=UPI0022E1197C|nr:receptor-type tyrosine-protein phosphatase kappa-like [Mya arenaria]